MKFLGFEFVFGFLLDLMIGDRQFSWHPVRIIGRAIKFLEKELIKFKNPVRNDISNGARQKIDGIILVFLIVIGAYFITWLILKISTQFNIYFGQLISIFFCYAAISPRSLAQAAEAVLKPLEKGNLNLARKKLSMIVGRDTEKLNKKEIIRAAVETVAENTVDGVTSPLFYIILGGPALGLAYKAVNTLDSMVGYKNEKYLKFGWAAAKLDDLANYFPARLSGLIFPLASFFCRQKVKETIKAMIRDGKKHPSPNAGIPEAAMAGSLGIQLGGLSYEQGEPSFRPYLGEPKEELSLKHIKKAIKLMYLTSVIFLILGIIFKYLIL